MGAQASSSNTPQHECPPLVPTAPLRLPPHQPMVRYDKCTHSAYLDSATVAKRQATDEELTKIQYWMDGGLDDLPAPSMPFCGWPYCRRLIWGCCWNDADVLQRIAQPQLVAFHDLQGYVPPPSAMMVWVNYPNLGMARVVGYTSLRAATQQLLYFVVQKLLPFGSVVGDPFGAGFLYRVPSQWCQRMPAAVVAVRMDFNDVLVWEITDTESSDKIVTVAAADFADPSGRDDEAELRLAMAFLQQDWPQFALSVFPRTAATTRYMPTEHDLRRWYGFEPRPRPTTSSGGDQQQQQQQQQSQSVNVIRVGASLNLNAGAPRCAFYAPLLTTAQDDQVQ